MIFEDSQGFSCLSFYLAFWYNGASRKLERFVGVKTVQQGVLIPKEVLVSCLNLISMLLVRV